MSLFDRYAQAPYVDKQLDLSADAVQATDLHLELDFVDKPATQTQEMSELDKALREMSGPEFISWVISRVASEDVTEARDAHEPQAKLLDSTLEAAMASSQEVRLALDGLSDVIALIRTKLDEQEAEINGQYSEHAPTVRDNIRVFDNSTARAHRREKTADILLKAHQQMPEIETEVALGMFRGMQDDAEGHPAFTATKAKDRAVEMSKKSQLIETNIVICVAEQEHELRLARIAREALDALEPETTTLTSSVRTQTFSNDQLKELINKQTQRLMETSLATSGSPKRSLTRFLKFS